MASGTLCLMHYGHKQWQHIILSQGLLKTTTHVIERQSPTLSVAPAPHTHMADTFQRLIFLGFSQLCLHNKEQYTPADKPNLNR